MRRGMLLGLLFVVSACWRIGPPERVDGEPAEPSTVEPATPAPPSIKLSPPLCTEEEAPEHAAAHTRDAGRSDAGEGSRPDWLLGLDGGSGARLDASASAPVSSDCWRPAQ